MRSRMRTLLGKTILGPAIGLSLVAAYVVYIQTDRETLPVLVQGPTMSAAAAAVTAAGGKTTHELAIIQAVGATLSSRQKIFLEKRGFRVYSDHSVAISSACGDLCEGAHPYTEYPRRIGADLLHDAGLDGYGVTVAVLDSGVWRQHPNIKKNVYGQRRLLARYNAIRDEFHHGNDRNGHGTHVTSIILSSASPEGEDRFNGIAPNANLVSIKAFNRKGVGTYADVIRGLDWIVEHKETFDIRVLNLSFSAAPRSFYWDDPLNQAVIAAWQAGIVVVTSAGNNGPDPVSVGVPGNIPYVITVGAMSDAGTPQDGEDDFLTSFSGAGPTVEAFIKPEIVAPGGHIAGLMRMDHYLAVKYPEHYEGQYFTMSGTSQAAAVTTGVVALMLQQDPSLTPDDVKCRLLASARAALTDDGTLAYSPWQQGAGLIDAEGAVYSSERACANTGLNAARDLSGEEHFGGKTRLDDHGAFYIQDVGYLWSGSYPPADGYLWSSGNPWIDTQTWIDGNPWVDAVSAINGNPWVDVTGNPWVDANGNPWVDSNGNPWVDADGNPWVDATGNPWVDTAGIPRLPIDWIDEENPWSDGWTDAMAVSFWVSQQ